VPLFLPPPEGHCSAHALSLNWPPVASWDSFTHEKLRYRREEGYRWNGETVVRHVWTGLDSVPVKLRGVLQLDERAVYRFENLWLDNQLKVSQGAVELDHCAARQLHIGTAERLAPVVDARASLLRKLEAARGLVQLEYVTVLDTLLAERLNASDCILMPPLRKDLADNDVPEAGCVRHSRLGYLPLDADPLDPESPNDPNWLAQGLRSALCAIRTNCTTAHPVFLNTTFGQPGCGVLHPASPAAIQGGAEDGGELGAYHEDRHVLRRRAVLDKLAEVLPAGTEALLILDPTLACLPRRAIERSRPTAGNEHHDHPDLPRQLRPGAALLRPLPATGPDDPGRRLERAQRPAEEPAGRGPARRHRQRRPRSGGLALVADAGDGGKVKVQPGALYVDGVPARFPGSALTALTAQPDYPWAGPYPGKKLVLYADVWDRPVTALERPELMDPALHGADTATRSQTLLQVKWCANTLDPLDPAVNPPMGNGLATLTLRKIDSGSDPATPARPRWR
jgi:hypothetical protein